MRGDTVDCEVMRGGVFWYEVIQGGAGGVERCVLHWRRAAVVGARHTAVFSQTDLA